MLTSSMGNICRAKVNIILLQCKMLLELKGGSTVKSANYDPCLRSCLDKVHKKQEFGVIRLSKNMNFLL